MHICSFECIHVIRESRVIFYPLLIKQQLTSHIQSFYIQCYVSIKLIKNSEIKLVPYFNSYFCFYILIQLDVSNLTNCDAISNQDITYVNLIFVRSLIYNIYVYCLYYMPCLYFLHGYSFNNIYLLLTQVESLRLVDIAYFNFVCDYLVLCTQNILASKKSVCVVIFYVFTVNCIQNVG